MMGFSTAVLLLVASAHFISCTLILVCPRPENIAPCVCEDDNDYIEVTCRHVPGVEYLRRGIEGLKNHMVDELWIEDSNLGDVPGNIFNGTSIASITLVHSKIISLGNADNLPFTGLEFILKGLTITEGFVDQDNPLTTPIPLSHLKRLENLDFEGDVIPVLNDDWFKSGPKSLTSLFVNDCGLKKIGDRAFSQLENLSVLDLRQNELETFSRSALPEKATHLSVLWLSENKLINLPEDMLSDLPSLSRFYLFRNQLTTLPEDTWATIMAQLSLLFIGGNPFQCDENLKWIITARLPDIFSGTCATPEILAGKELSSLTQEDFKLFHKRH